MSHCHVWFPEIPINIPMKSWWIAIKSHPMSCLWLDGEHALRWAFRAPGEPPGGRAWSCCAVRNPRLEDRLPRGYGDAIATIILLVRFTQGMDGNGWMGLPVVPHKAVAEVSEGETYRRGWLWITDGRGNPLIDRKVVGVVFVGVVPMVAVVTSPTTAGCSVVCCSCSRSRSVVEL